MNLTEHISVVLGMACQLYAEPPTFRGLGFLQGGQPYSRASAISADGNTVVGVAFDTNYVATRWSGSGVSALGQVPEMYFDWTQATDVSSDGAVVVGYSTGTDPDTHDSPIWRAFAWTQETGIVPLYGPDPHCFCWGSRAFGISPDGTMIVGQYRGGAGYWLGTEWTYIDPEHTGFGISGFAHAVSDTEPVIVGSSNSGFRFSAAGGLVHLTDLPGGQGSGYATNISRDGRAAVGYGTANEGIEACRWVGGGPPLALGDLPGGVFHSEAYAITANGSVVVGIGATERGPEAFLWDPIHGMRNLAGVLATDYGLGDQLQGWILSVATDITPNVRYVCGTGVDPQGYTEGWVASFGDREPGCPADFNHNGFLDSQDFFDFIVAFFVPPVDCAPNCPADFNHSGNIDTQDFFDFLTAFFAGCP